MGYFYLDDLTRESPGTFARRFIEEATGAAAAALLFPLVVLLERVAPLDRGRWRRTLPAHVAGLAGYSVIHTTLMAASRAILFPLLGYGAYDYGLMTFRYFMEASQDLFTYATFIGALTLVRSQQRDHERSLRSAQLERDLAAARLESLSLQLRPHFLFNALNTISSVVYESAASADQLIGQLGELLRHSLRAGRQREIPLAEELEVLNAYLALVSARFQERVSIELRVLPDAEACLVPTFLLQPLVENAVHHGMQREFGATSITITAAMEGGALAIGITNTLPLATAPESEEPGIGLGSGRARLALLYGDDASLTTSRTADEFTVVVRIPRRYADESAATESHAGAHR